MSTLTINKVNLPDCGVYAIDVMGKTGVHYVTTLNVELTDEKQESPVKCYDFIYAESQWVLMERGTYVQIEEVKHAPKIPTIQVVTPLLEKYTATSGRDFRLPVLFKSSLTHQVNWYSNDTMLVSGSKYEIVNDESSTALVIRSVDATDQQEYTLVISNEQETVTYKTYLFVHGPRKQIAVEKPQPAAKKPVIQQNLEPNVKANVGENVRLSCVCDLTQSKIEWYHNQTNITEKLNKSSERYEYVYEPEQHRSTLIIKSVKGKDRGEYTFCARNNAGVSTSTCIIDVQESTKKQPVVSEIKNPIARQLEQQVSYKMGENADLSIYVVPKALKQIQWFVNGVTIKPNKKYTISALEPVNESESKCSLIVHNVNQHDQGQYTCRLVSAANGAQFTSTCYLNVEQIVNMEQQNELNTLAASSLPVNQQSKPESAQLKQESDTEADTVQVTDQASNLRQLAQVVAHQEEKTDEHKVDLTTEAVDKIIDEVEPQKTRLESVTEPILLAQPDQKDLVEDKANDAIVSTSEIQEPQASVIPDMELDKAHAIEAVVNEAVAIKEEKPLQTPKESEIQHLETNQEQSQPSEAESLQEKQEPVPVLDNVTLAQEPEISQHQMPELDLKASTEAQITSDVTDTIQEADIAIEKAQEVKEEASIETQVEQTKQPEVVQLPAENKVLQDTTAQIEKEPSPVVEQVNEQTVESTLESDVTVSDKAKQEAFPSDAVIESQQSDLILDSQKQEALEKLNENIETPASLQEVVDVTETKTKPAVQVSVESKVDVQETSVVSTEQIASEQASIKQEDSKEPIETVESVLETKLEQDISDKFKYSEEGQVEHAATGSLTQSDKPNADEAKLESVVDDSQLDVVQSQPDLAIKEAPKPVQTSDDFINSLLTETATLDELQESSTDSFVISQVTQENENKAVEETVQSECKAADENLLNESIINLVTEINIENKIPADLQEEKTLDVAMINSTDSIVEATEAKAQAQQLDTDSVSSMEIVNLPSEEQQADLILHQTELIDSPDYVLIDKQQKEKETSVVEETTKLIKTEEVVETSIESQVSEQVANEEASVVINELGNVVLCGKNTLEKRDQMEEKSDQQVPAQKRPRVEDKSGDDDTQAQPPQAQRPRETSPKPPRFTQKLTDQAFYDKDNLHLDCFVEGSQPISITWSLNEQVIQSNQEEDSNVQVYRESGVCSLEIIESAAEYQGTYKCVATNNYGQDETCCELKMINKAPRFVQQLQNQEFYENKPVHLDCMVEGKEPIKIEWFFKNRLVETSMDSNLEIFREVGVCSLQIVEGTLDYQGEYKCVATNEYGSDVTNCWLKTIYMNKKSKLTEKSLLLDKDTLEFIEPLRDQIVELGREVYLDCTVKNLRKTDRIEWYLNHEIVEPERTRSKNTEIFFELGVCSLQIRKMKSDLQGFYSCKVRDLDGYVVAETGCYITVAVGELTTTTAKIQLIEDKSIVETIFSIAPRFVNELNSLSTFAEGDQLKLVCRLNDDCEPKPNVIWFKDGKDVSIDVDCSCSYNPKSGECRLVVQSCSKIVHEGVYTCVAALPDSPTEFITKTFSRVRISSSDTERSSGEEASSDEKSYSPIDDDDRSPSRAAAGIAPMFLQSLEDTELEEGEDLELKCQIMGAPIPEIFVYFTKDITNKAATKKLKQEYTSYNLETGICRIQIKNVKVEPHEGFYMVKAVNDVGQLSSACQVKVGPRSVPVLNLDKDCKPTFVKELEPEIRVMDGQEISMQCICSARPEPEINWLRLSGGESVVPVSFTSDVKSMFDASTGRCVLKISDTYPQDAGVYICSAKNKLGQAETRTSLVVECI